jgi:hypothetical protein
MRTTMSEGNGYLSVDALTKARPLPERDVDVPALGGKVRIRGMTVSQRGRFEKSVQGKNAKELRQRLLVATIVKPEGLTSEHIAALGDQDASILEPLVNEALDLVGATEDDIDALVGNSSGTTGGDGT